MKHFPNAFDWETNYSFQGKSIISLRNPDSVCETLVEKGKPEV